LFAVFVRCSRTAAEDGEEAEWGEKKADPSRATVSIHGVYEPDTVRQAFLTTEDEKIRKQDIPERLFLGQDERAVHDEDEREKEAMWILQRLNLQEFASTVKPAIVFALKSLVVDHLEPPYINQYQSEYLSILNMEHLWQIVDLDKEWNVMALKKESLEKLLRESGDTDNFVAYNALADNAGDEQSLNDLYAYVKLTFAKKAKVAGEGDADDESDDDDPMDTAGASSASSRRAKKRNLYTIGRKAGLNKFAIKFALSAAQLGEAMASTDGLNRLLPGTPRDPESKPISPQQFVSDNKDSFPTVKDLMGMSCGMLAYEISMEPRVRKAMRDVFRNHASISTVPLKSKETELDVFHTHFEVAYINRKPVMGFLHKQPRAAGQPMPATLYLKMLDAEKAGYITLTFDLPNSEIFLDRLEPVRQESVTLTRCMWILTSAFAVLSSLPISSSSTTRLLSAALSGMMCGPKCSPPP
jgi:transcription elongation factor SPT6